MQLLIDGDIIVYRCGAVTNTEPVSHALHSTKMMVNSIVSSGEIAFGACTPVVYLTSTDKSNYRNKIAVTRGYKANRPDNKPVHYDAIRKYLVDQYDAIIVTGQEADDALGIAQMQNENSCICTLDKDLDMIPGHHYNFVKKTFYEVSEKEAIKNFYTQLLVGDSVDNIPGAKGIGKVKAKKLLDGLETEDELYSTCLDAYNGDLELMTEMGQLLWIRRAPDQLWEPPKGNTI